MCLCFSFCLYCSIFNWLFILYHFLLAWSVEIDWVYEHWRCDWYWFSLRSNYFVVHVWLSLCLSYAEQIVAPTSPLVLRVLTFLVTYQEVFVKNSGGVVVVGSKAINYLHLYRLAVGMSGADNDWWARALPTKGYMRWVSLFSLTARNSDNWEMS